MSRLAIMSCGSLLLLGCAATPYQPADSKGYGYAEQKDTSDAYTVMFVANTATSEQQAEDFALLRASELGMSLGFTYIKVSDSKSGIIALGNHGAASGGSDVPTATPSTVPHGGMGGGMGMQRGYGGGYGGTGSGGSYTFASSSGSSNPARACVLRVQFYKQEDAASDRSAQDMRALVNKLDVEYGLSAPGGGH